MNNIYVNIQKIQQIKPHQHQGELKFFLPTLFPVIFKKITYRQASLNTLVNSIKIISTLIQVIIQFLMQEEIQEIRGGRHRKGDS